MKKYKTVEYKGKKYEVIGVNATFTEMKLKNLETDEIITITDTEADTDVIDTLIKSKPLKKLILSTDGYYWTEKDGKYDKKYELALKEDGTVVALEAKED